MYATAARTSLCLLPLRKMRRETDVGKYVDSRYQRLTNKLSRVLRSAAKQAAEAAAKAYAKLIKADEDVVRQILADLDLSELSATLVDAVTPELVRAFKQAGIAGLAQVGFSATADITNQMNQKALDYAEERGAELVTDLEDTTRDALRSTVSQAVEDGMSPAQLADAVQSAATFNDYRAEMIARTELAYAHVGGTLQSWRETGEVEGKKWYTAPDCCDECQDLDGEEVGLDEDFPDDGGDGPPLHPNCRCTVLAVLTKEDGSDDAPAGSDDEGDQE